MALSTERQWRVLNRRARYAVVMALVSFALAILLSAQVYSLAEFIRKELPGITNTGEIPTECGARIMYV